MEKRMEGKFLILTAKRDTYRFILDEGENEIKRVMF